MAEYARGVKQEQKEPNGYLGKRVSGMVVAGRKIWEEEKAVRKE